MVYENIGSLICRKASYEDIPMMYDFILPYIKNEEYEVRRLHKLLKYYVKIGTACIVENNNNLVGLCTSRGQDIHHLACKGGPKAALLLFYVVMCGLHNKYTNSSFISFESNKKLFEKIRTPEGKACIIDSDGNGTIPPSTKNYIEQLFRRFKNE